MTLSFKRKPKYHIKAIFFDIGGVICKDIEKYMMRDIAKKYNIPYEKIMKIRSKWWRLYSKDKISEKEYWNGVLKDTRIQEDYTHFLFLPYKIYIREIPHMKKILETLAKRYNLYVLSDHSKDWWDYAKNKFQLQKYFQGYILSFEYGILKDDQKLFLKALKLAKVNPQEALFIDNSPKNILVAKSLGIQTLLFINQKQLARELKNSKLLY